MLLFSTRRSQCGQTPAASPACCKPRGSRKLVPTVRRRGSRACFPSSASWQRPPSNRPPSTETYPRGASLSDPRCFGDCPFRVRVVFPCEIRCHIDLFSISATTAVCARAMPTEGRPPRFCCRPRLLITDFLMITRVVLDVFREGGSRNRGGAADVVGAALRLRMEALRNTAVGRGEPFCSSFGRYRQSACCDPHWLPKQQCSDQPLRGECPVINDAAREFDRAERYRLVESGRGEQRL